MKRKWLYTLIALLALSCSSNKNDQLWPQFRGVNGAGVASNTSKPPITFGDQNLKWETEIPNGVSSPIIWEDKIFVTGYVDSLKELQTLCLDRKNGKKLWVASVVPDTLEKFSQISSPAQGTPITDGERVISYFGSCGLFCYDMNGKILWSYPLRSSTSWYGSANSPIMIEDKVILLIDSDSEHSVRSINKVTGELIWKSIFSTPMFTGPTGHSTPLINDSVIFIHRLCEINAVSLKDGSEIWNYKIITSGTSSPIIAGDKVVVSCWQNFSEEERRGMLPDFDALIEAYDKDKNRLISQDEIPDHLILYTRPEISDLPGATNSVKPFFGFFDSNNDQLSSRKEWEAGVELIKTLYKPAGLIALNLSSKGSIQEDKAIWRVEKNMPEVPTPIFYNNRIYTIKDGGVMTCINPQTGNVIYSKRIGNSGSYISSPIAANDNLYIINAKGRMKIIKASDKYEEIGSYDFKENVLATPALSGKYFYIRTSKGLRSYKN